MRRLMVAIACCLFADEAHATDQQYRNFLKGLTPTPVLR